MWARQASQKLQSQKPKAEPEQESRPTEDAYDCNGIGLDRLFMHCPFAAPRRFHNRPQRWMQDPGLLARALLQMCGWLSVTVTLTLCPNCLKQHLFWLTIALARVRHKLLFSNSPHDSCCAQTSCSNRNANLSLQFCLCVTFV